MSRYTNEIYERMPLTTKANTPPGPHKDTVLLPYSVTGPDVMTSAAPRPLSLGQPRERLRGL